MRPTPLHREFSVLLGTPFHIQLVRDKTKVAGDGPPGETHCQPQSALQRHLLRRHLLFLAVCFSSWDVFFAVTVPEPAAGPALWYLLPESCLWDTRFLIQTAPAPGGQVIAHIWETGAHVKPGLIPIPGNTA